MSIINYTAHTRESVVLDDATHQGQFAQDPYIKAKQPKSVLCAPLLNQGNLIGMIYLENNLTSGTFTPERLEVLNILSSQAAISIENANLYSNLERSEKKYRTIFENSKDAIFITNAAGQFIDINEAGLSLFGYSQAEIGQMQIGDIYAKPAELRQFLAEIQHSGSVSDFESTARKKDGSKRDCLITATARLADDGSFLGYEGIIRDITERNQAEQERLQLTAIQKELDVAHTIQASLLPNPQPNWSPLKVICHSTPAREVGGDFYTYQAFAETQAGASFAVAIGDVTGKGTPAALLMSVSLASLETVMNQDLPPSELMAQLDAVIARYTGTTKQNCALCYAKISKQADGQISLTVANAGCIPPIIQRVDGTTEWLDVGGMPLGVGLGSLMGYQEVHITLSKGDLIILSSDGVVEANNAANTMFGFDKFEEAVSKGPVSSAEAMLKHLNAEVAAFVQGVEPHDDLTLMVVQV
jgi:PAS domain S-box-containing protein